MISFILCLKGSKKNKDIMYKVLNDYFEQYLDCIYHYTDTDGIFI